jgi:hypothetical protein
MVNPVTRYREGIDRYQAWASASARSPVRELRSLCDCGLSVRRKKLRFASDSPLEEARFEPSVPPLLGDRAAAPGPQPREIKVLDP